MELPEAVALIRDAVVGREGVWVDLGAGHGVFTRALAELLNENSRIYAVDRDARALSELAHRAGARGADVKAVEGDLTQDLSLPGHTGPLDGMLLANSLHFVADQAAVLGRLVRRLRPGGRLVLVEYDRRASSRWVPYPIPLSQLAGLTAAAGLSAPRLTASRPSEYGGVLYSAAMDRPEIE
jgi:ubiquinone/menaquinone biosynthesis C-methylase UbiE